MGATANKHCLESGELNDAFAVPAGPYTAASNQLGVVALHDGAAAAGAPMQLTGANLAQPAVAVGPPMSPARMRHFVTPETSQAAPMVAPPAIPMGGGINLHLPQRHRLSALEPALVPAPAGGMGQVREPASDFLATSSARRPRMGHSPVPRVTCGSSSICPTMRSRCCASSPGPELIG